MIVTSSSMIQWYIDAKWFVREAMKSIIFVLVTSCCIYIDNIDYNPFKTNVKKNLKNIWIKVYYTPPNRCQRLWNREQTVKTMLLWIPKEMPVRVSCAYDSTVPAWQDGKSHVRKSFLTIRHDLRGCTFAHFLMILRPGHRLHQQTLHPSGATSVLPLTVVYSLSQNSTRVWPVEPAVRVGLWL